MQAEQFLYPSADISRGRCFSRGYGMLIWLHLLLLSDDALWMSFLHLQHVTSERRRTWSFFTLFQVLLAELNKCNCSAQTPVPTVAPVPGEPPQAAAQGTPPDPPVPIAAPVPVSSTPPSPAPTPHPPAASSPPPAPLD